MNAMTAIHILLQATTVMGALLAGFFWFNSFGIKDQDEDLQRIARLKSHAATAAFVAAVAGTVAWVL
jgi:hypothetical protein